MRHPLYNMPRAPGVAPRWTVVVYYQTDHGMVDVEHLVEELDMMHDLIERGPDWNTIDRIEVRLTEKQE